MARQHRSDYDPSAPAAPGLSTPMRSTLNILALVAAVCTVPSACAVNPVPTPATETKLATDRSTGGAKAQDAAASSDATTRSPDTEAANPNAAWDGAGADTGTVDAAVDAAPADTAAPADSGNGDASTADCAVPTTAGHHEPSCAGIVYDLHVPATCTANPCGLVVDVHGLTMSGEMQDNNTGMRKLGEKHGYVVLQPNANPAPPGASWTPNEDDQKILDYLQAVIGKLSVDKKRIHFTGFSQGGWMSWRMLCKQPQLFASIAPGAGCSFLGTEGCTFDGKQLPAVELPVLYMHGTKDVLQGFDCAKKQLEAVTKAWGLQLTKTVSQDDKHIWQRYASAKGTVFEFIQHDYAASSFLLQGHCYPGSDDQSPKEPGQIAGFGCKGSNAFHWGEAAIAFFIAHPKP